MKRNFKKMDAGGALCNDEYADICCSSGRRDVLIGSTV